MSPTTRRRIGWKNHGAFGACGGGMARSRRIWDHRGLVVVFAGLLVLTVLTGQVSLSNGIVKDRAAIAALEADRDYLKTRIGLLELDWNRRTSRDVIVARAGETLGLLPADGPPVVLVAGRAERSDGSEREADRGTRWLAAASAGERR